MVKLVITFSNLLADEIAKEVVLTSPNKDHLNISDFLSLISEQEWAEKIIENDHLKTSIVLIIDDEIIQFSNPPDIKITATSKISCHVMFAGGL
ncbi:MAG: hypothetical protein GPJ54_02005 [Candidatus Heimdallarchaeota archaeon]|nr:hypothetical protein [Candidatus Heimdallarchaeota archaeon]